MRIIKKMCTQEACYWAPTLPDDFGNPGFEEVVSLKPPDNGVRWEEVSENYVNPAGQTVVSRAKVYALQDLELHGWLWLGKASELEDDTKPPEGAWEIKQFSKIPTLKGDQFVRIAYL